MFSKIIFRMGRILSKPYRILRRPLDATVRDFKKNLQAKVTDSKAELVLEEAFEREGMVPNQIGRSDARPIEKIVLPHGDHKLPPKSVIKTTVPTKIITTKVATHKQGQRPSLSRPSPSPVSKLPIPSLDNYLIKAVGFGMLPGSLAIALLTFIVCLTVIVLIRLLMYCSSCRHQPKRVKGSYL